MKSSCLLTGRGFFYDMIVLTRNIDAPITNTFVLTLSEHQAAPTTWYHFTFIHRVTQDEVMVYLQNISTKSNFQKFQISSNQFNAVDTGYYTYEARAANSTGTAIVGGILETGYMVLNDSTTFAPTKYDEQSNQFKTYNG